MRHSQSREEAKPVSLLIVVFLAWVLVGSYGVVVKIWWGRGVSVGTPRCVNGSRQFYRSGLHDIIRRWPVVGEAAPHIICCYMQFLVIHPPGLAPACRVPSRNKDCPCGSRQKYKNCCGTAAAAASRRQASASGDAAAAAMDADKSSPAVSASAAAVAAAVKHLAAWHM